MMSVHYIALRRIMYFILFFTVTFTFPFSSQGSFSLQLHYYPTWFCFYLVLASSLLFSLVSQDFISISFHSRMHYTSPTSPRRICLSLFFPWLHIPSSLHHISFIFLSSSPFSSSLSCIFPFILHTFIHLLSVFLLPHSLTFFSCLPSFSTLPVFVFLFGTLPRPLPYSRPPSYHSCWPLDVLREKGTGS